VIRPTRLIDFIESCAQANCLKTSHFFILAIIPLCLERIWIIFGRNTAGGIYSLLLCAFTYYVIVQLGLLSVAIETELKSTAPGTHHTRWLHQFPSLAVDFILFPYEKDFQKINNGISCCLKAGLLGSGVFGS